ncbi:MAG: hypothetical protein MZV63_46155 [Marinilabiliales bacterium]|nr:hypothetical protein [Marinilabiliales bacterium]
MVIPIAAPRSPGPKTCVTMAREVEKSIAPPIPWRKRAAIRRFSEGAKAHRNDARVKTRRPTVKIFFRPTMSAYSPEQDDEDRCGYDIG